MKTELKKMVIGQRVSIKCHVFRQNKRLSATVKEIPNDYQLIVLIDGNTKKTKIALTHVTKLT